MHLISSSVCRIMSNALVRQDDGEWVEFCHFVIVLLQSWQHCKLNHKYLSKVIKIFAKNDLRFPRILRNVEDDLKKLAPAADEYPPPLTVILCCALWHFTMPIGMSFLVI